MRCFPPHLSFISNATLFPVLSQLFVEYSVFINNLNDGQTD